MGVFGNLLGGALGSLGSALFPIKGINGQELGSSLGGMLPFRKGGKVKKAKKTKTKAVKKAKGKKKGKGRK